MDSSVQIEGIRGSVQNLKRAKESARDVLYGIPRHEEEERPISTKIVSDQMVVVHEGDAALLPEGGYLVENIKYKYVTVLHDGETYDIELDGVNLAEFSHG